MRSITINNLTKRTADIQKKISLLAISKLQGSQTAYDKLLADLSWQIENTILSVERILQHHVLSPAGLAIRSRRAYQWILFLSKNENLPAHLDALQRIVYFLPSLPRPCYKDLSRIDFSFFHISPLYRVHQQGNFRKVVVGESFIFSPDPVIMAVMKVALCNSSGPEKSLIREYSYKKEYKTIREQLEYLSIPAGSYSSGRHYDLGEVFTRVNEDYFNGTMSLPHLVWSDRNTQRKFGHFQEETDTVLISRTLDQPGVPQYVLDYVMYHELLHKKLGSRKNKNRRYTHTSEFRRLESVYKELNKAQNMLKKIANKYHRN